MSIFNELLPKINEISLSFTKKIQDDLKVAFECFDKFEKSQKGQTLTTLQSINEDEGEASKPQEANTVHTSNNDIATTKSSFESAESGSPRRASKKRSKNEVDGIVSPEQDKRQKRSASVKAQNNISKQVNVNLTQKLRREIPTDKPSEKERPQNTRGRRKKDDKENVEPPVIQIKQEKVSLPPEPMDSEESLPPNIEVKQEVNKDDIAMPPPMAPIPKPRKALAKDKSDDSQPSEDEDRRRTTRTRKQTDTAPPVPPSRPTRASSRASSRTRAAEAEEAPPAEPRPKRTRAKKKVSESSTTDTEKETASASQQNGISSPAEKPRPKRTRRGQKAADKTEQAKAEETPTISPKEERVSAPEVNSPILPQKDLKTKAKDKIDITTVTIEASITHVADVTDGQNDLVLDETRVIPVQAANDMDKTMVLPNGVYNHAPVTPKNVRAMNETVVIDTQNRDTFAVQKPNTVLDATVVLEKEPVTNISEDNSLLTDDSDYQPADSPATPKQTAPEQPSSAVKEKVQQFEELASRVTRTKTRAMAKKQEEQPETQTPPDRVAKPALSAETLAKMNNMIFNGKPPQISSSATKPRANTLTATKSQIPSSTSKLSSLSKHKETADDTLKREKEDARKKKEAMLEAKREQQKRKREEKMAAAAAAREAAERERRAAMEAAARDRQEKQAHVDLGKMERVKEAERKKLELARKMNEMEERRRADELARVQRLAEEQRRADLARRKQLEEHEATKKEAARMAKEIEKRQKEYLEKQKLKQRLEEKSYTPLKTPGTPGGYTMEPVHMTDGFQYLNSDEDEEPPERPIPEWSTSKARKQQLLIQSQMSSAHVDRLFSVRVHSPDLRAIFPNIERARLKRTSSAVWRTPPRLTALRE